MLREFLKANLLGTLYIDEVFFFYEEPQIFTCVSKTGQKYLGLLTDMSGNGWMLVPMSEAQLSLLKSNRISVREAFVRPEDEFLWKIKLYSNSSTADVQQIFYTDIDEEDLPDDDVYIDYCSDELMPVVEDDLLDIAKKERRDILDLSLKSANKHKREIECEVLGEVLSTTQQILYTLPIKNDSTRGRIPKDIRNKSTIVAVGTFAASFGVRLKSPGLSDLLGETDVTSTIRMFTSLLEAKSNEAKLKELLKELGRKTIFKYRRFMKVLLQADVGLQVRAASPNNYCFRVDFTTDDIIRNLNLLEGEIKDMVSIEKMYGTMVGIHVDKKTFAFKSIEDESIIGKLSENFNGVTFEVPKFVEAKIEQRITFNEVTNEEKYIYTLLSINVDVESAQEDGVVEE